MKQLALDFASQPLPTLDNFVAGRNGELLENLRRLAAGQARERFFYVWGRPGSGRSHLLKGVAAAVQRSGAAVACIACDAEPRLRKELDRMDFVLLDDVERLDEEGQIAAFDLYNSLRERNGALVASASAPPVQLAMREDLGTRLAWGLVYQVQALSDDDKAQALADHAATRGWPLPREVSDYLLRRSRRDMPSLLATLDALDRYSLETRRPVTVPLVRELLETRDTGVRG
jgi:DnaA family protein